MNSEEQRAARCRDHMEAMYKQNDQLGDKLRQSREQRDEELDGDVRWFVGSLVLAAVASAVIFVMAK